MNPVSTTVQLLWQNPQNLEEVQLVDEADFTSWEEAMNWITRVITARKDEIPKDWCPLTRIKN